MLLKESFAYDSGRQSVLEILNTLFFKFPKEIMDQYAEFFFLPLLVRLANEESPSVHILVNLYLIELV